MRVAGRLVLVSTMRALLDRHVVRQGCRRMAIEGYVAVCELKLGISRRFPWLAASATPLLRSLAESAR